MSIQATNFPGRVEHLPLVVDVDGTLVASDLLQEAALQFIARYPFQIYRLAVWLVDGKSNLKTQLAARVNPGIETVPLRAEVLTLIRDAQATERPVYLASASDRRYIEQLAERIGGIAGVFGTDVGLNLAGEAKADQLVAAFGIKGYDYIGDTTIDFAVWRLARKPLVVIHSAHFGAKVLKAFPDAEVVAQPRAGLRDYVTALRTYQWAKNILLFLPMVAGHRFDLETIAATLLGFLCFCLAASSAYVVNDLLDLPGDRDHPRKSCRPFAAGKIPITHGVLLAALLMSGAFLVSLLLPWRFDGILSIYVACTLGYSLLLKRKALVDVIMLGGLYTLRVYGGLAATNTHQTQWLLMFCLFLFLSLAIVKRCSELVANRIAGRTVGMGRGYRVEDLNVLLPLGAAAGYGAVFVVTLYLSSPEMAALYAHPNRLWLICPLLLYWISRVLVLANRGEMHDDPIIFAMTDRISWLTGVCAVVIIAVSI
jgi:4-hydroxybenzoate polyprenyltransferase